MLNSPDQIVVAVSAFFTGLVALVFLPACLNGITKSVKELFKADNITVRNKH